MTQEQISQEELIQRLKEAAEYDGWKYYNDAPNDYPKGYYMIEDNEGWANSAVDLFEEMYYHTSFDWSVPVWSKVYEEAKNLALNSITNYEITAYYAINGSNQFLFFITLSDLIREVNKCKQSKTE